MLIKKHLVLFLSNKNHLLGLLIFHKLYTSFLKIINVQFPIDHQNPLHIIPQPTSATIPTRTSHVVAMAYSMATPRGRNSSPTKIHCQIRFRMPVAFSTHAGVGAGAAGGVAGEGGWTGRGKGVAAGAVVCRAVSQGTGGGVSGKGAATGTGEVARAAAASFSAGFDRDCRSMVFSLSSMEGRRVKVFRMSISFSRMTTASTHKITSKIVSI